jgi:hypothetical protein
MTTNPIPVEMSTPDTADTVTCDWIPREDSQPGMGAVSSDPTPSPQINGLTPVETRAQDPAFVNQCSLRGLMDHLPLVWPVPPDIPDSPKKTYRSAYVYLGWDDLKDSATWEELTDFDLLLRWIDFSPLRSVLAYLLGWTSARGQVPFDPISIYLLLNWQIVNGWNRAQTLRNIQTARYADYAQRFGFKALFPTEGAVRYFLTTIGERADTLGELVLIETEDGPVEMVVQALNQLIVQSVTLIRDADLLSPEAWQSALLCPDGMLHQAASRRKCTAITDTCYSETSPEEPRPCPARAKKRHGCDCNTLACVPICQYAPARDSQARFVWYAGSNKYRPAPNQPIDDTKKQKRGKGVFGYRSIPLQLADSFRRFSLILLDAVGPATACEGHHTAALLRLLPDFYPSLHVDAVSGDANFGTDPVLSVVYDHLKARRVIDLHGHHSDRDRSQWLDRGYDDRGRPVCTFGYRFTANGFDFDRRRHKWICGRACRNGAEPVIARPDVPCPPDECPYLTDDRPHGHVINIAKCFPIDGSIRLVRDVPVGSPTWRQLYHRARNAVEGRNSALQEWGLKRMSVFGLPRVTSFIFLADVLINLTTLARLVREATAASGGC